MCIRDRFGTDYKIDMQLDNESPECALKVDKFFSSQLSCAELSIKRPIARIYNVPASAMALGELFFRMEEGLEGKNGFNYFTCSSSSLERVFMEIVRMSEAEEEEHEI